MFESPAAPEPVLADRTAAGKFIDPEVTLKGEPRAEVALKSLRVLWFNTGTLCNITCDNCYIESSPRNDRLVYLTAAEVAGYLDEVQRSRLPVEEVAFTGGEPFMNRDLPAMLGDALARGFRVLVLTNAMKPMQQRSAELVRLRARHGAALALRVSIDHFEPGRHEQIRGAGSWAPMLAGLRWLAGHGFAFTVASRTLWGEDELAMRAGFAALFRSEGLALDALDPAHLVLFPEMDPARDVPEITTRCWSILNVSPDDMMCATSRMVVKRKGAAQAAVVSCTLLPYDPRFELGETLGEASRPVKLNHPFCAQFCVLGGASCSAR